MTEHVAIIGAGITGITTAAKLLDEGFEVTVFDRHRYAAMETSFANGGQLSASNAEVWNTWATVLKGIKWLARADAPLLVNPRPSWHKLSWMAEFLGNIPKYRANTIQTVRLALAARHVMDELAERSGVDFDLERRGIVHFYKNQKDLETARKVTTLLGEGGLERVELSADDVRAKVPQLDGPLVGGFFTESDATGDIHKFTVGLADWVARRGGHLELGHAVDSVKAEKDRVVVTVEGKEHRFDRIVVAAGIASRDLAAQLGDRVNIYPVKGYSITVDLDDAESQAAAPWMSLLDDDAKIVTSRLGKTRFRVAGTAEFNGENRDIRADRIAPLTKWVEDHFPGVSTERVVPWAGLRPMMPSMLPRLGRGRNPRVFYNTGHGHLGWTLSAATAEIVAAAVGEAAQDRRPVAGLRRPISGSVPAVS